MCGKLVVLGAAALLPPMGAAQRLLCELLPEQMQPTPRRDRGDERPYGNGSCQNIIPKHFAHKVTARVRTSLYINNGGGGFGGTGDLARR